MCAYVRMFIMYVHIWLAVHVGFSGLPPDKVPPWVTPWVPLGSPLGTPWVPLGVPVGNQGGDGHSWAPPGPEERSQG